MSSQDKNIPSENPPCASILPSKRAASLCDVMPRPLAQSMDHGPCATCRASQSRTRNFPLSPLARPALLQVTTVFDMVGRSTVPARILESRGGQRRRRYAGRKTFMCLQLGRLNTFFFGTAVSRLFVSALVYLVFAGSIVQAFLVPRLPCPFHSLSAPLLRDKISAPSSAFVPRLPYAADYTYSMHSSVRWSKPQRSQDDVRYSTKQNVLEDFEQRLRGSNAQSEESPAYVAETPRGKVSKHCHVIADVFCHQMCFSLCW